MQAFNSLQNKMQLKITKTTSPKEKPDFQKLGFGKYFSDHMFTMKYSEGQGWYDPEIVPYAPISLEPSALVLHYGQETFEGLKAYKDESGVISLFRPRDNFKRMINSNDTLCIPAFDPDFVMESLKELLKVDADWIPTLEGTSMYIRPFIIATEPQLGVKVSSDYLFLIILSPVGSYYEGGLAPTNIYVEEFYIRAAMGGTGSAKYSGNYAASLKPYKNASNKGYTQVLFLDGVEKRYIEEVGTSNAFFVIDGELITPPLAGTILPGITRDSSITIAKDLGYKVNEIRITIDEVLQAASEGKLQEVFATGTAAVISPVGQLTYKDQTITVNDGKIGEISQKLYDTLTSIQYRKSEDKFGWVEIV
jgi:branched-chain amino acid aminotransferase